MATHTTHGTIQFIPLSPLDNIMPRVYTRIILCIQTEKIANPSAITALLSKALRKTVEQVPFLDGEVVPDTTTNTGRLGRFAVRVSQPGRLQLQSKNLTEKQNVKKRDGDDHGDEWKYSFPDLAKENWQPWLFDGNILAPVASFPDPFDEMPPVMAAKATFVEGGLLLCVAFHHMVIDGTGIGTLIRLWAQNCREIETLDNNVAKNIHNVVDNDKAKTMEKLDLNMPRTVEKVDQNVAEMIDNVDNNAAKQVENVDKTADEVMEKNILAAPTDSAIVITPEALDRTPLMSSGNKTEDDERTIREGSRQHPEYAVDTPLISPSTASPVWIGTVPTTEIAVFYFSGDALARLKDAARGDLAAKNAAKADQQMETGAAFHEDSVPWISTNDALSALLWSSITRARHCQGKVEDASTVSTVGTVGGEEGAVGQLESKLGMANNGRHKLNPPLPKTYIGNVNLYSLTVLPVSSLRLEGALPNVARLVRASVNHIDNKHIRSAVRFIDALPDIAALKPGFAPFMGMDLAITSWAEMGLNGLSWGHGVGTVERVRVPAINFDGLCVIFPRTKEGGLEVLIGLSVDAMKALKSDKFFMGFAMVE
ncbi:unnamed protein product [Calypogeia fissa]